MEEIVYAVTKDGKRIPFRYRPDPPRGSMKHTYFAPDRSYVVQFFNDSTMGDDPFVQQRLEAIIGKYNPTRSAEEGGPAGNEKKWAEYFAKRFCWPMDSIVEPEYGIVCPAYPENFFFDAAASPILNLTGKDKRSTWYTEQHRRYLTPEERGDLKGMLEVSFMLAQAVRRMHQAGLAHTDLSCNNVLIDPKSGSCIILDIDALVVPGIFPAEVVGTRGYMAPEVVTSFALPRGQRVSPSVYTDLHALAVLLYEYIFCRHPLDGKRVFDTASEGKNDFLKFGPKAIFVEHPEDTSNRPKTLDMPLSTLGETLEQLFLQAFVKGLHHPEQRPTAMEWERGLSVTLDRLEQCQNSACPQKWFVARNTEEKKCPFCGRSVKKVPYLQGYHRKKQKGQWRADREIHLYGGKKLYSWHILEHVYPNEKAEQLPMAEILQRQDRWYLKNIGIQGLADAAGKPVHAQEMLELSSNGFWKGNCGQETDVLFRVLEKR